MSSQFDDEIPPAEIAREGWILVRIHVPELDIFKCLQFPVDKLIWDIKQQVLASLPKVSSCLSSLHLFHSNFFLSSK